MAEEPKTLEQRIAALEKDRDRLIGRLHVATFVTNALVDFVEVYMRDALTDEGGYRAVLVNALKTYVESADVPRPAVKTAMEGAIAKWGPATQTSPDQLPGD